MLKNLYTLIFTVLFSSLFISSTNAQWTDNFDSYTAGSGVACQNPTNWSTWSNAPCGAEDMLVSNVRSLSAPNSFVSAQNQDMVALLNQTSGTWFLSFNFYIETGQSGYFNILSDFTFGTGGYWAFECYFDVGGAGRLVANHVTTNFTYNYDTWNFVEVMANLGSDQASFTLNGTSVLTWPWTQGSSVGVGPLTIDAADFFGATVNDEMYVDNFWFNSSPVPVELTSFTASVSPLGQAVLNWVTASEINNRGFEVERKAVDGQFITVGFVEGYGTTSEEQSYTYVDQRVTPGSFVYRLKQIDFDGQFEYSNEVELDVTPPLAFGLDQNYPNPFNPNTTIKYSLSEPGNVRLAIYNTLGEEVAVLVNNYTLAGFHEMNFDASNLPSGTYVYRLETPGYVEAKKMILMK